MYNNHMYVYIYYIIWMFIVIMNQRRVLEILLEIATTYYPCEVYWYDVSNEFLLETTMKVVHEVC